MEPALDVALSCLRNPSLVGATRDWPLPEGMLTLLRLAAGDEALAGELAQSKHRTPREIVDAAIFFVHQVLFDPAADSYRTLGVRPDAGDAQIKEHYRWLVRWQHPDRAKDVWDGVYADRVNLAWQDLRTPERRRAYDERAVRPVEPEDAKAMPRRSSVRTWHPVEEAPLRVPARWTRLLPTIVLGSLALVGISLVALIWSARPRGLPPATERVATSDKTLDAADRSARMAAAAALEAEASSDRSVSVVVSSPGGGRTGEASDASHESSPTHETSPVSAPARAMPPSADSGAPDNGYSSLPHGKRVPNDEGPPSADPIGRALSPPHATTGDTPVAMAMNDSAASSAHVPAPIAAPGRVPAPATAARGSEDIDDDPPPVDVSTSPPALEPIDRLAAEGMLHRLSRAYVAGDLPGLLELFSADARNNRGGIDAITEDYRKLFSDTSQRELSLDPSGWMERGDEATLLARYRARVKSDGELWGDRSDGWIRFELRREDGELKISRIIHERDS